MAHDCSDQQRSATPPLEEEEEEEEEESAALSSGGATAPSASAPACLAAATSEGGASPHAATSEGGAATQASPHGVQSAMLPAGVDAILLAWLAAAGALPGGALPPQGVLMQQQQRVNLPAAGGVDGAGRMAIALERARIALGASAAQWMWAGLPQQPPPPPPPHTEGGADGCML